MENQLEKKPELAKAILQVMRKVRTIDKDMQVGEGKMAYKGVADESVKDEVGNAMIEAGLIMLPIDIDSKSEVSRWEETNSYKEVKQKQSVFTEVKTKYLLLHESGESIVLSGLGHGVDSQDKGAGKATTYALKYTLLYTFLIATKKIDDADTTHSDNHETPKNTAPKVTDWLSEEQFLIAMNAPKKGILATLQAYNGQNGKGMKKDYLTKLTAQLENAQ